MDKPYVVGIDVGGTNTVVGIVDKRGQILKVVASKRQNT
jgi:glucokinase